MRIQIASDLHREMDTLAPYDVGDVGADLVILAGDIDRGSRGVRWAAQTWTAQPVVFICGNHEAYGSGLEEALHECRAAAEGTNIHVLQGERTVLDGVRVLGTTLWTDFALFGQGDRMKMAREVARDSMNDYHAIRRRDRKPLRPEDTQQAHRSAVAWLADELAQPHPGATVVVTHHAPHPHSLSLPGTRSTPADALEYLHAAYASDLSALIERYLPTLWIHGHTHQSGSYQIGQTRVVSNQRGYYNQSTGWDSSLVVDV